MTGVDRPTFFETADKVDKFDEAITEILRLTQRKFVRERLSEENTQRFTHGTGWSSPSLADDQSGKMKTISSGWEVHFEDIIKGDLSVISKSIRQVSEDMKKQFSTMMYSTISDACAHTGNTVDAKKAGSISAGFLEMIRKIELSVGKDGKVEMPEIHAAPEMAEKMIAELSSQPPEFAEEVERIKAEKTAEAFAREEERKRRFKRLSK